MSDRPSRRPIKLSDLYPQAQPKQGDQKLEPNQPDLRVLDKITPEVPLNSPTAKGSALDQPAATCWPPDPPTAYHSDDSSAPMPAFSPPDTEDGIPWVDAQLLVPGHLPRSQPFPVETLPQPVYQFIVTQAKSLNCDTAAVALPVLSVLASVIGGNRRIELKRGWSEPAILWTALVNDGPSPHEAIVDAAVVPLQARQAVAEQLRQELFMPYRRKLATYRYNQRSQPQHELPPAEPIAERSLTTDWSLSSLSRILSRQARGLLVCPQELDGWLRRTSGNGERASLIRQAWLDLDAGRSVTIEGRKETILTPASVSLTGTMSAALFEQKFAKQGGACELTSRLLFASPEARPQCWTEEELDQETEDGYAQVIQKLFSLPEVVSCAPRPSCVTLSPDARDQIDMFMTDLGTRQLQIDEALFHWTSHLVAQAARLALVIHLSRWAAGEVSDPHVCDVISMQDGIALARWFAYEAQRVLKKQSLSSERRDQQQLYAWLLRHPGPVTIRDVCRSNSRKYPTAEAALVAMTLLVQSGLSRWISPLPSHKGGRPTVRMEIIPPHELNAAAEALTQVGVPLTPPNPVRPFAPPEPPPFPEFSPAEVVSCTNPPPPSPAIPQEAERTAKSDPLTAPPEVVSCATAPEPPPATSPITTKPSTTPKRPRKKPKR